MINIQLTVERFNPDALAAVTSELRGRGLTIKESWMGEFEPTTPDMAQSWKITTSDECLVSQNGKRVKVEAVGKQRQWVLGALVSQGVLTAPPSYAKGARWVAIYCILQVAALIHFGPGPVQAMLALVLFLLAAGVVLAHACLKNNQPRWPMVAAYVMMAPSLITTYPASLLNLQTLRQYITGRNYVRTRQYLGDSAGAEHDTGANEYGGFWIRFGAYLIDALVVTIPFILVFWLVMPPVEPPLTMTEVASIWSLGSLLAALVYWLYYTVLEASAWQASAGKMAVGLRVVGHTGDRLSIGRSAGRSTAKIVYSFWLVIGFLMVGWTENKQGLHDIVATTYVVKATQ